MRRDFPMKFDQYATVVAGKLEVVLRAQQEVLLRTGQRLRERVAFAEQKIARGRNVLFSDDHVEIDEAAQGEIAIGVERERRAFVGDRFDAVLVEEFD